MEIEVPSFGVRAVATLYDDWSAKTISALKTSLPFSGPAIHAMRAGREVFTLIPKPAEDPGPENQSVFPVPGDLYLFHQPEGYRAFEIPTHLRAEKHTTEYWHIAVWYGRDSFPMTPTGVYPGNHFGEVTEGLDELAVACERIRFEGTQDMSFRLID
jgi:hypothetical protein